MAQVKRRTFNPRLVSKLKIYQAQDVADLFGIHKHTVMRWIQMGLPVVDDKRKPFLIRGGCLIDFIRCKQATRKTKLKPQQFFCMKCKTACEPFGLMVDAVIQDEVRLQLKAICGVCDCDIYRAGSIKKLPEYQKAFQVQVMPERHIAESSNPVGNVALGKDEKHE